MKKIDILYCIEFCLILIGIDIKVLCVIWNITYDYLDYQHPAISYLEDYSVIALIVGIISIIVTMILNKNSDFIVDNPKISKFYENRIINKMKNQIEHLKRLNESYIRSIEEKTDMNSVNENKLKNTIDLYDVLDCKYVNLIEDFKKMNVELTFYKDSINKKNQEISDLIIKLDSINNKYEQLQIDHEELKETNSTNLDNFFILKKQLDEINDKNISTDNIVQNIQKFSNKLSIEMFIEMTGIDKKYFLEHIFGWCDKFNFKLDGDYITIGEGNVIDFAKELDNQFNQWSKSKIK